MENNEKTPLSVMSGSGSVFEAQGKKYRIRPMKLREVDEFYKDNLILADGQFFNMTIPSNRKSLNKWLEKMVTANDQPLSLEQVIEDDWDLNDLRACIRRLIDISG
jgi:hypothetical protein